MRYPILSILLLLACAADGAEIRYEVSGVSDELAANVLSHLEAFQLGQPDSGTEEGDERLIADARKKAARALRPYGYYDAVVDARFREDGGDGPVMEVRVQPGMPILVDDVAIDVVGDGANDGRFRDWRDQWPLATGAVLDQTVWEAQKQRAIAIAGDTGYLSAEFTAHALEIDLIRHRATLKLTLDTGPRYSFGDVTFSDHVLKPGIVEYIPRFEKGDPFSRRLLDKFRTDLWKTGYFTNVEVEERQRSDVTPPVVDLSVEVATDHRNSYQGSIGVGSDTGMRIQAQWSRHPMSSNGDRLDLGIGWREKNDELSLRGNYRLPRRERARQYWTGDLIVKDENHDLVVRRTFSSDDTVQIANGRVDEYHLRTGRLKVRNFKSGEQQAFETLFVQFLHGNQKLTPLSTVPDVFDIADDANTGRLLNSTDNTISVGFDYDLVAVYGKGWETKGHRERAWVFTSNEAIGSDVDFTQIYLSTRRSYLRGERWKFIVRAEAGYTDAAVDDIAVDLDGQPLNISLTRLPNFYRFKAGGSNSVRGYGFEELSNNLIGSNHIFTASAEVEMKFLQNWSAALFFDIGNAFNDWSRPELRKGVGIGFRWYSIAGPIRVDFANAIDTEGRPWRLHFTIGTPLL